MTTLPIYDGAIKAHKVSAFVKCGIGFDIIRPGYDSQGRRHASWTQIVHEGVPIYTARMMLPLEKFIARFEEKWAEHIGDDLVLMRRALEATKNDHMNRFKDGVTGETPAPSLSRDGQGEGINYLS